MFITVQTHTKDSTYQVKRNVTDRKEVLGTHKLTSSVQN